MDGTASVSGVGAVVSQAQFQVAREARVLKEQQSVAQDIGSAALRLISAAVVSDPAVHLDLTA